MISNDAIDERVAELVDRMGQRLTRRGVLAKVGSWAFKIAGLSLVPLVLPVDRAYAQFGCLGDWQTCGMRGYFCKACCGGGATYATCPGCTNKRGCWPACCSPDGGCTKVVIQYCDCCGGTAGPGACTGDPCHIGGSCPPNPPAYCNQGEAFHCTIVLNTGNSCSTVTPRC